MPNKALFTAELRRMSKTPSHKAPDGFSVWELAETNAGEISKFEMGPRTVGRAIKHKTVTEIWIFVAGDALVWIEPLGEEVISAGTYFTVPPKTAFQINNTSDSTLVVLAVTMPKFHPSEVDEVTPHWAPCPMDID